MDEHEEGEHEGMAAHREEVRHELSVIASLYEALDALPDEARGRVFALLLDRYPPRKGNE